MPSLCYIKEYFFTFVGKGVVNYYEKVSFKMQYLAYTECNTYMLFCFVFRLVVMCNTPPQRVLHDRLSLFTINVPYLILINI